MTTLRQHAKTELRAAGLFDADSDFDGDLGVQVTSLMDTFLAYDHSGGSAEQTLGIFSRLAKGLPLVPLTGDDDEWYIPQGKGGQILANKRCIRVFKDEEMAWDVAVGRKPITFPYMPE
jgi:hypothetical protein